MTYHTEFREDFERARKAREKNPYASERYDPTLPYCGGTIELRFNGEKLTMSGLIDNKRPFSINYAAVSGTPDRNNNFDYSIERQKKRDQGPIPEGKYWIRPDEFWENSWYKLWDRYSSWGNFRITLHPFTKTETYGRGGFFIHGGTSPGSIGCVDLTGEMDGFYKDIQVLTESNSHCQIELFVAYQDAAVLRDGTVLRRHTFR